MAIGTNQLIQSLTGDIGSAPNFGESINQTQDNAGMMEALQNVAGTRAGGDAARGAISGFSAHAKQQTANEDELRRRENQRIREEKAEQEALEDPRNYKAIIRDDGGYDFFDARGNPISAIEYARATNKRITDILKNSENPDDRSFVEDYEWVMEMGRAMQRGDAKARDKLKDRNPELYEVYKDKPFQAVVEDLHTAYPEYFRGQEAQRQMRDEEMTPSGVGDKPGFIRRAISALMGR